MTLQVLQAKVLADANACALLVAHARRRVDGHPGPYSLRMQIAEAWTCATTLAECVEDAAKYDDVSALIRKADDRWRALIAEESARKAAWKAGAQARGIFAISPTMDRILALAQAA